MENSTLWYLENIDLPGILCPKKQAQQHLMHSTYKKGEYIFIPQDKSDRIYFLNSGKIKIGSLNENGKEITKVILGKGEVFGEHSLAGENYRRDFAYCLEDCDVCIISTAEMTGLFRNYSGLTGYFMKLMGSRVIEMENRLESLVFRDARSRIVNFLVEIGKKKGQKFGDEWLVKDFLTHQEIANLTATSRQTVSGVMNELRKENLIAFSRSRLMIRNISKLEKSASDYGKVG
ncbi:MAG: Crp/Fnr family transcriptional regulator [Saprospiraceae bacterium]